MDVLVQCIGGDLLGLIKKKNLYYEEKDSIIK